MKGIIKKTLVIGVAAAVTIAVGFQVRAMMEPPWYEKVTNLDWWASILPFVG